MERKTKSKLFSKLDMTRDENFAKDLRVLSLLPDSVIDGLAEYAVTVWLARGDTETDIAADKASSQLRVPRAQLDHALRLSSFLMSKFVKDGEGHDDKPENIVSDMETVFGLSFGEKRVLLLKLVEELKNLAQQNADAETRQRYALRSLPVLTAVSISADYRLVFDREFKPGDAVSSFRPDCLGTIPIAVVQLVFDSGPTKNVFFQADKRTLSILIDHLRAVDKELDVGQRLLDLK